MKRFFAPLAAALALAAAPAWAGTTILVSGGALVSPQNPLPITGAVTQTVPWEVTQSGAWNIAINAGSNTIGGVTLPQYGVPLSPWNAPGLGLAVLGEYESPLPTLTSGQTAAIQVDGSGRLLISPNGVTAAIGSGTSGSVGSLILGAVTSAAPSYTTSDNDPLSLDTNGNLRVTGTVGLAAGNNTVGGVTLPHLEGGIAPASPPTSGIPILGQYNPLGSLPNFATGQVGAIQTDINGRLLLSPSGITIQAGSGTANATGGLDFGAAVATPQADTAGDNYPLTLDPYGNLRTAPSPSYNALSTPINIATATTTQLVGLVSAEKIYVTNLNVIAGGTGNITFEYGTGTNCGTGTTALTGPYPLTAQAGLAMGSGTGAVLVVPAGNALCALTSAAVQMSGSVAYQQY